MGMIYSIPWAASTSPNCWLSVRLAHTPNQKHTGGAPVIPIFWSRACSHLRLSPWPGCCPGVSCS